MKRRNFIKALLGIPIAASLPVKAKESEAEKPVLSSYKEVNCWLRDCEKQIEQEYLKRTGWPLRIKLDLPPSVKVDIAKGVI